MQKVLGVCVFQVLPARKSFHCSGRTRTSLLTGQAACQQWHQAGLQSALAGLPGHPDSSFHGCHGSSSMPGFSSPRGLQPLSDMLSSSDSAALCCPAQRKGERGELGTSAEADGQGCWAGTHPKWQVWDRHGLTGQMLSASGKLKRD